MPSSAKTRLLLAFGGASSEHEISIRSARSVLQAVDRERFEPLLLGIRRDGGFRTGPATADLAEVIDAGETVTDVRGLRADLCFPVLHGPHGEDGTFQGFCEILGLPYVGSGVLASALCMDKVAQKQLVDSAAPEVPLVPWLAMTSAELADSERLASRRETIAKQLGFPCFVKPANLGSSVGVVKVGASGELEAALREAARYDARIVVERGVDAREIELAVLGNGGPETMVSRPGLIAPMLHSRRDAALRGRAAGPRVDSVLHRNGRTPAAAREVSCNAIASRSRRWFDMSDSVDRGPEDVVNLTAELLSQIRDGVHRNGERLEALTRDSDRARESLGRLEVRVGRLEHRLDRLETRMDGLESRLSRVETRLTRVETRLTGVETRTDQLVEAVTTLTRAMNRSLEAGTRRDERLARLESALLPGPPDPAA